MDLTRGFGLEQLHISTLEICDKQTCSVGTDHGYGYGYGYEAMGMGTGTGSTPWVWVRVRVRDHGYGYGYGYDMWQSHGYGYGYGYETIDMGMQGRIHVWSESAPAPLLTDKSCKFSLFQVIFGLFSGYISHPAPHLDLGPPFYISWIRPWVWVRVRDHGYGYHGYGYGYGSRMSSRGWKTVGITISYATLYMYLGTKSDLGFCWGVTLCD